MTTTTEPLTSAIKNHHAALARTLETYLARVEATPDTAPGESTLTALATFLTSELLPHAQGEERTLYPALDPLLRAPEVSPTATMRVDHEYLGQYARDITATAQALRAAPDTERTALTRQLARQLLKLQTLFAVHLAKEERVYLPVVEAAVSGPDQERLLAALHAEAEEVHAPSAETPDEPLDVRETPAPQRHPLIFSRFDALAIGESFILINDHDPKPLRYQLVAEYPGELLWEYLEQGPTIWRVRMGKAK